MKFIFSLYFVLFIFTFGQFVSSNVTSDSPTSSNTGNTTPTRNPEPSDSSKPTSSPLTSGTPKPSYSDTPKPTYNGETSKPSSNDTPNPSYNETPKPTYTGETLKPSYSDTRTPTYVGETSKPSYSDTPSPSYNETLKPTYAGETPKPSYSDTPKPTYNGETSKPSYSDTPKPSYNETPKPTYVGETPKPTYVGETPKPSYSDTPKPSYAGETPKPSYNDTPKPTPKPTTMDKPTTSDTNKPTYYSDTKSPTGKDGTKGPTMMPIKTTDSKSPTYGIRPTNLPTKKMTRPPTEVGETFQPSAMPTARPYKDESINPTMHPTKYVNSTSTLKPTPKPTRQSDIPKGCSTFTTRTDCESKGSKLSWDINGKSNKCDKCSWSETFVVKVQFKLNLGDKEFKDLTDSDKKYTIWAFHDAVMAALKEKGLSGFVDDFPITIGTDSITIKGILSQKIADALKAQIGDAKSSFSSTVDSVLEDLSQKGVTLSEIVPTITGSEPYCGCTIDIGSESSSIKSIFSASVLVLATYVAAYIGLNQ